MRQLLGSETISKFFYMPEISEQSIGKAINSSQNGIFIGSSLVYSVPFFLDFDALINPHVFILGMSGGGKTFLMKSLLLKIHAALESTVLVVDFTGEYMEALDLQSYNEQHVPDPLSYIGERDYRILYFNLKGLPEGKKIKAAGNILDETVKVMRSRSLDSQERIFILLDEAWKLLKEDRNLETIIREGRKYKVGLILASQLIEDMELPMLASSAALFVFKIQNKRSLEKLSKNYNLGEKMVRSVQNLNVGSCLAIQVNKHGIREAFLIKKVLGVSMKKYLGIMIGDIVIEMEEEELAAVIRRLCIRDPSVLISEIMADRSIELHVLIRRLLLLGADRRATLRAMKDFGMTDYEISDAFAFAIEEIGVENEGRLPN